MAAAPANNNNKNIGISVVADEGGDVLVSLRPPVSDARVPLDVACVIDVSGSMAVSADLVKPDGSVEETGYTVLDIVKHAVNTVAHILGAEDRLAIVTYSSAAAVLLPLTPMNASGQKKAAAQIPKMDADGSTNLFAGLIKGLEVLQEGASNKRLSTVLILTDGQPNDEPAGGHIPAIKQWIDKNGLTCSINTFGFGYQLDSKLMNKFALIGNGMYAFIPDSSFTGTAFVHAVSNLLTTMTKTAKLSLEPLNGAKIDSVLGNHNLEVASWGVQLNLGGLQFGQTRDLVLKMSSLPKSGTPFITATLKYETRSGTSEVSVAGSSIVSYDLELDVQRCRCEFVDVITSALLATSSRVEGLENIRKLIEKVNSCKCKTDPRVVALLQDLTGQVTEAFSKYEWYSRWGIHYLPSLIRAHFLQQCNNFKDPGVQVYGSALFSQLKDKSDEIFSQLPPPKRSITLPNQEPAPASMSSYMDSRAPCFGPECLVRMYDGSDKPVKAICKKDVVMSLDGKASKVICVMRTACHDSQENMVELDGGLQITPWHPIFLNGCWCFPAEVGRMQKRKCSHVYSFLLDSEHSCIINGTPCVTLGHNVKGDKREHAFWGTEKIVKCLQSMPGWNKGLVAPRNLRVVRDPVTTQACDLCFDQDVA